MGPVSRAPVAPSGGPRAPAPPLGFTRSQSHSSSRPTARTWQANASLISMRSKSPMLMPVRWSSFCVAGAGPMPMIVGATPIVGGGRAGVAGGHQAVRLVGRLERRQLLERGVLARALVGVDLGAGAVRVLDNDRLDLLRQE